MSAVANEVMPANLVEWEGATQVAADYIADGRVLDSGYPAESLRSAGFDRPLWNELEAGLRIAITDRLLKTAVEAFSCDQGPVELPSGERQLVASVVDRTPLKEALRAGWAILNERWGNGKGQRLAERQFAQKLWDERAAAGKILFERFRLRYYPEVTRVRGGIAVRQTLWRDEYATKSEEWRLAYRGVEEMQEVFRALAVFAAYGGITCPDYFADPSRERRPDLFQLHVSKPQGLVDSECGWLRLRFFKEQLEYQFSAEVSDLLQSFIGTFGVKEHAA